MSEDQPSADRRLQPGWYGVASIGRDHRVDPDLAAPLLEAARADYERDEFLTGFRLLRHTPLYNELGWPALAVPMEEGLAQVAARPTTKKQKAAYAVCGCLSLAFIYWLSTVEDKEPIADKSAVAQNGAIGNDFVPVPRPAPPAMPISMNPPPAPMTTTGRCTAGQPGPTWA